MSRPDSGNVDHDEISRFEALAARWWDREGEMGALHVINPPRLRYIQQRAGGATASIKGKRTMRACDHQALQNGYWAEIEDLRENWARDAEWAPKMDAELREKEYAQWKKAVTRTFAWVD